MFKSLFLLFLSRPVFADEQRIAGNTLTTVGIYSASIGPPVAAIGGFFLAVGAAADDYTLALPGLSLTLVGFSGILSGFPMMLYGNEKMIQDLNSKGGSVSRSALNWSYGWTLSNTVSTVLLVVFPEFPFEHNTLYLGTVLLSITGYTGAIITSAVQRSRTRAAFLGLEEKNTRNTLRPAFGIRPVVGYRKIGLVGHF